MANLSGPAKPSRHAALYRYLENVLMAYPGCDVFGELLALVSYKLWKDGTCQPLIPLSAGRDSGSCLAGLWLTGLVCFAGLRRC